MVAELYKLVVGNGWVAPREFWAMHPTEVFWLVDARRPRRMYGHLTESEMSDLHADLVELGVLNG